MRAYKAQRDFGAEDPEGKGEGQAVANRNAIQRKKKLLSSGCSTREQAGGGEKKVK